MNQELYNQFLDAAVTLTARDEISNNIEAKKSELQRFKANLSIAEAKPKQSSRRYKWLTGIGIFLTIFGFLIAGVTLLSLFYACMLLLVDESYAMISVIAIIIFALPFLVFGIVGICLINLAHKRRVAFRNKAIKQYEELKVDLTPKIAATNQEISNFESQLAQYIEESAHFLEFLPAPYHTLHAVGFMLEAIERLRAHNLTDVINLYEQELHHLEQMQILHQTAEMQRIHAENMEYAMEAIQRNQDRINSNLRNIQMLQYYNIYSD